MPARVNFPDIGNSLLKAEAIKGKRIQNSLAPQRFDLEKRAYDQRNRQGQQVEKRLSAEYEHEKFTTLAGLMSGVTDDQTYKQAVSTYMKMFSR